MSNEFKMLLAGWVALGLVVIALAVYHKMLVKREYISLHVDADSGMVGQQAAATHRIDMVEKWGKALTTVEVLYGLGLATMYLYAVWTLSQKTFWSE